MPVMRTLLMALMVGSMFSTVAVTADALTAKAYEHRLNEYFRSDCDAKRREEIISEFRHGVARDTLRKDLSRYVVKPESRGHALAMGAELQVYGLYKKIMKDIDGPHETVAVKYLFKVQDPGSTEVLYERWESKRMDSESYKLVYDGFTSNMVRMQTVDRFANYAKGKTADPVRAAAARRILMYQMGKNADDPQESIEKLWKAFKIEEMEDPYTFALERDKIRIEWSDFWRTGRMRTCNMNYKLYPGASMELFGIPDDVQDRAFYLKCRMRVLSGDGATIALHTASGGEGPVVQGGKWASTSAAGQPLPKADLVPGKWEEITIFYRPNLATTEKYDRICVVTVERVMTAQVGSFNGKFEKLVVSAGGGSTVVVGCLHYYYPKQ